MKNPLTKKIVKEFRYGIEKYIIIFLFMLVTISFVSGFLVAGNSMKQAYDESFEKYNIEDGNFELTNEASETIFDKYEDTKIYSNYYVEMKTVNNSTLRIFKNRDTVNKVCIMKGEFPKGTNEIAIDRMYADNNNLSVGDEIKVGDEKLKISGLVALSDYSALFSDNNDIMFDSIKFGVAVVSSEKFNLFDKDDLHYSYSWKYCISPKDDIEAKEKGEDLYKLISEEYKISKFTPRYINSAINFAGDDMGGDKTMMIVLMYILTIIIGFIFAIITSNTINNEATIIGTLRAMGYSKKELIFTYMAMPIIVTLVSAVLGNILGYSVFKDIVVNLYYGSYSLPTYKTIWTSEAFILTTIIPIIIIMIINVTILTNKLSLSPQKFLRRNLSKKQRKKLVKLPPFKFLTRFRLRIVIQNSSNYIVMFIGVIFANIILMFGLMMVPLIDNYKNEVTENMISKYQYILKAPIEIKNDNVEKYAVQSLKTYNTNNEEEISVYGIESNSKYLDVNIKDKEVCISDGFSEKYSLKIGDIITLKEQYGTKEYEFKVSKIYHYPASLSIFINRDYFNDIFGNKEDYFNGYFSDEEITNIDKSMIASIVTEDDLTKLSRQLDKSMGGMFNMVKIFAVILYMVLIYLLSKVVIEKNSLSISMVKILGYSNKEISKLYIFSTTIVVLLSIILSIPISKFIINMIYRNIMAGYSGWIYLTISYSLYVKMFLIGILAYTIISAFQFYKIKKVRMDVALKTIE